MTICIAAISEKNKVVSITDKMLTLGEPVRTAYEISENNKIIPLNDSVVALFAGDVIHANEILQVALKNLSSANPESVRDIAEIVNGSFTQHWQSIITNVLQRRFQIDHQTFMHNQPKFDPDLVKQVSQFIANLRIDVEIIVAGTHGEDSNAHIYTMDHSGSVVSQDSIGYACIGSGSRHATLSLIESEISSQSSLSKSLLSLLKAKSRAEYDPGVGSLCDIVIIKNGAYSQKSQTEVDIILKEFKKHQNRLKKSEQKVATALENLC